MITDWSRLKGDGHYKMVKLDHGESIPLFSPFLSLCTDVDTCLWMDIR